MANAALVRGKGKRQKGGGGGGGGVDRASDVEIDIKSLLTALFITNSGARVAVCFNGATAFAAFDQSLIPSTWKMTLNTFRYAISLAGSSVSLENGCLEGKWIPPQRPESSSIFNAIAYEVSKRSGSGITEFSKRCLTIGELRALYTGQLAQFGDSLKRAGAMLPFDYRRTPEVIDKYNRMVQHLKKAYPGVASASTAATTATASGSVHSATATAAAAPSPMSVTATTATAAATKATATSTKARPVTSAAAAAVAAAVAAAAAAAAASSVTSATGASSSSGFASATSATGMKF